MFKRDAIFWIAAGLFALSLILLALTGYQFWLGLMIGSYLLRPTLTSLGIKKRLIDERQISIHYRSGNIAFAIMILACVLFLAKLELAGDHAFEYFALVIAIGLAGKALFNVLLVKNYREAAAKIILWVGLLIALFGMLDGGSFTGALIHALPGLVIACVGILSYKFPRPTGILILLVSGFLVVMILGRGITWGQIGTAVLIGVPLILAGLCLFFGGDSEQTESPGT